MFKNYLKVAWRNIKRQKAYSIINIVGLAVGLTISLVIAFYVYDDITFDKFHEHAGSIYRVCMQSNVGDGGRVSSITAGPLLPASRDQIPEVVKATRFINFRNFPVRLAEEESLQDQEDAVRVDVAVCDPDMLEMFTFPILSGNPEELAKPNAVFITPELAATLFGDADPMGQPLQVPNLEEPYVAGLIQKPPTNSHIQFDMMVKLRVELNPVWWDSWENQLLSGYVRLHPEADHRQVAAKMDRLAHDNNFPDNYTIFLQPLLDAHLHSKDFVYDFRNLGKKDITVVYVMTIIGILILTVAAINFINLSSAKATQRAREVGMRKVVGSDRRSLVFQFLGESILITAIAMTLAVVALHLFLPYLEGFLQKQLSINMIQNPRLILIFAGVTLGVGLISGVYPALILSGFKPVDVLRGRFATGKRGVLMRRLLVIFQFTITVALIFSVMTVLIQIRYLKSVDLGYERDQVLGIFNFLRNEDDLLRDRLRTLPQVEAVGRTSRLMGEGLSIMAIPEGFDRTNSLNWWALYVDEGFFKTLEIEMASGRNFSCDIASDAQNGIIINESALGLIGWDQAVNRRIDLVMEEGGAVTKRVVGVVKDFHFTNTRSAVGPMVFLYDPGRSPLLLTRLAGGQVLKGREIIDRYHKELFPDRNNNAFFLDDVFDNQFNGDREFASHLGFFAGVAIFIACLGLVGLVSFAVEQRRKEIAIRKVLGCSELRIVTLLKLEFLKWILVASGIAWPVGYFAMQVWLREFYYQMPFSVLPFVISGLGALIIAMLTISVQSIRAARRNPALALRLDA